MKKIQGKSTLVRVSARFELSRVNCNGDPQDTAIFSVQLRYSMSLKVKERTFKTQKREILRFVHNVLY